MSSSHGLKKSLQIKKPTTIDGAIQRLRIPSLTIANDAKKITDLMIVIDFHQGRIMNYGDDWHYESMGAPNHGWQAGAEQCLDQCVDASHE